MESVTQVAHTVSRSATGTRAPCPSTLRRRGFVGGCGGLDERAQVGVELRVVEPPVRAPAAPVIAGNVAGDVAVVLEFVEVARDRGTRDPLTERGDELRCAETTPVFGQRHGDRELDAVHANADQRVQPDGERGVGVGRHAPIVSVVRGKGRRDTMSNLYR